MINIDFLRNDVVLFSTDQILPEYRIRFYPDGSWVYMPRDFVAEYGRPGWGAVKNLTELFKLVQFKFRNIGSVQMKIRTRR